jgi:hypothetical protein
MPGRRGGDGFEQPSEPGWYPDPWSATGEGERYFDGKRWGTSERPLGRQTTATIVPIGNGRKRRRARRTSGWDRRTIITIVVVLGLVAVFWEINRPHSSSNSNVAILQQPSVPSTTIPTDRPPRSHEEASKPLGIPAPAPSAPGKYEVLLDQWDNPNTPVAFDPCRPIHYVVNLKGAPADGLSLIKSALARVQTATGLHFIADGTTTEGPTKNRKLYQPTRYGDRWAPVLIAWSQASADGELAGYIAGLGQPLTEYTSSNRLVYVTGQVVFDSQDLSIATVPDRSEVRAVMLHEFGHLVGLDHTADRKEIMFSEAQFNVRDYGPGDLRGLAQLGTQACYPNM